ncbi:MAG: YgiQ family radical SAM protein [Chloroflexota bacterium]|nr:YgiQ family radical SAM protein [Chloroflexota bacterium]
MFLPTTRQEMLALEWEQLDVILVTGDAYIDSPFIGVAVIGHVLADVGYRVGIIAQPDIHGPDDITRLGEPALFWGVTGGSIDSLVANYTALKKPRRSDDYTPGGRNTRRPDRAVIVYTNLIRRYFKDTAPIVLGGIEASLRRVAHYDYWDDAIRRAVLLDAKADYLLYGMAEQSVLAFADALRFGDNPRRLRGLCYVADSPKKGYLELPAYAEVADKRNKRAFTAMFHTFYRNNDPRSAQGLYQQYGNRYLIQNPPAPYLTQAKLDDVYALDFEREVHPYYKKQGEVRALQTIKFAVSTHRGCYGECNFCAIAVHEGRTVRWRSLESIVAEARKLTQLSDFKGYIQDVSGPTANMYGFECPKKLRQGACPDRRCLSPQICPALPVDHSAQLELLRRLRALPGVKKVFVASGLRYDLLLHDQEHGAEYLQELVAQHVSGQLKVAPEHTEKNVLREMGKPGPEPLLEFRRRFFNETRQAGLPQFLTYYFIAAHPGCTEGDMHRLRNFAYRKLKLHPEQVQIFTPTPSTYASLMYYTKLDPFTGERLFVEQGLRGKRRQKNIVVK